MANISNANSTYGTGGLDTQTTLDGTYDATFQQMNGAASAAIAIETVLGDGPTLKGSMADLVTRLAVALTATGTIKLTGFSGLTVDRGLTALSATEMIQMNMTPIGVIQAYGGAAAPTNWLLCDGTAVNRTTYAKLFTAISTAYGVGDGSTTFNLPDLRGRVPIGVDGAANRITAASTNGANADTLGGVGGAETHTLTTAELASHSHSNTLDLRSGVGGSSAITNDPASTVNVSGSLINNATAGSGNAHSNTQPWQTVNYIIFAGV